jgi:GNAT superfamily N-acetyltransferase
VFEISSTVWEGNDYLPEVWDAWMAEDSSRGFLLVGEIGAKVVAVQHLEIQPQNVGWLEGIRVHERYRNQGIARRMLKYALELAGSLHLVRARLSVSSQNEASNALVTSEGFRELDRFHSFTAPSTPPDNVHSDGTTSSTREDLRVERCGISESMLQASRETRGDANTLIVAHGWTAMNVPGQKSPLDFDLGLTVGSRPDGLLLGGVHSRRNRVSFAFVNGTAAAVSALGEFSRQEAGRLGLESAGGMLRRDPEVEQGLSLAGYELREDHVMVVYGRTVEGRQ